MERREHLDGPARRDVQVAALEARHHLRRELGERLPDIDEFRGRALVCRQRAGSMLTEHRDVSEANGREDTRALTVVQLGLDERRDDLHDVHVCVFELHGEREDERVDGRFRRAVVGHPGSGTDPES